jgi:5-formyltetrahydrofolate cyclo-ligase
MSDLAARKTALRTQLRRQRVAVPPAQRRAAATAAARHMRRLLQGHQARHVAVYLAHGSELDPAPLVRVLLRTRVRVYVPKIGGNGSMRFVRLSPRTPLRRNRFGIPEPVTATLAHRLDAIVLPLVGFDATGTRLGTGGGYYDRALAHYRSDRRPLRIGYSYARQEVTAVPAAAHDIHLHAVVTERGVKRF